MPAYDNEGATISMEDVRNPDQSNTVSTIEDDLAIKRLRRLRPQKSTISSRRQQAVCVRRAYKKYGTSKNPNVILDGLNMTVPKGAIYGLLGASGCGKTTLLSCIVGRRRLNSGEIWVLGGKPGSPGSGVPGPRIGYMPQEIALFGEFTIKETMTYFGWIAGMSTNEVEKRIDVMISLLQLPDAARYVKNLSGGQQRRVSLASALIHDPELLILDEPTVGVDPVLRQSIWDHLVEITRGGRTTVIITTHYIDETKQANIIGLMRGGRFLAEESPSELIRRYQGESLEDVFLKLAVLQNRGKRRRSSILADVVDKVELPGIPNPAVDLEESEMGEISGEFGDNVSMSSKGRVVVTPELTPADALPPDEEPALNRLERIKPMKWHHMKALIWKNTLSLVRNFGVLAFIIGLPVIQMTLFCLAVGHYPVGLPIAVVDYETNSNMTLCDYNMDACPQDKESYEWNLTLFSCRYLEALKKRQSNLIYYPTEESAMSDARKGNAKIVIVIPKNFTESLQDRMTDPRHADSFTIDNSVIDVHLDDTNKQMEWILSKDLSLAFAETVDRLAEVCQLPSRIFSLPVHFHDPIYGVTDSDFTDFAAPGVILTIIYFLAVALTSGAMLAERNEGILERSLVSGITGTEILFSHVTVQIFVMAIQSIMVMLISFALFGLSQNGPLGWISLLVIMTGLCGMTFGFLVSCLCDTDRTATYMALGSFLPMVLLCGIIWPIEAMHILLQWISFFLPLTKSTESLRSMLQRGWSIEIPSVYSGFISTSIWIVVYLTTSILLLKFKKG
ncbi:ABC transporter G family member 23 [Galleria mellonella]|uniref:ABC transporter G family member 23 n=1 Tax=Galleria mellonella TaxID=7137 RepID=A0A6J1WPZ7_GALME|nr:ABC transporter G family member 23 [Galleria mellonella]XP_026754098.3 ABC transporter G family member 23 [Galleria mellonella]